MRDAVSIVKVCRVLEHFYALRGGVMSTDATHNEHGPPASAQGSASTPTDSLSRIADDEPIKLQ